MDLSPIKKKSEIIRSVSNSSCNTHFMNYCLKKSGILAEPEEV